MRCLYMIVGEAGMGGGFHNMCVDLIRFVQEFDTNVFVFVVVYREYGMRDIRTKGLTQYNTR